MITGSLRRSKIYFERFLAAALAASLIISTGHRVTSAEIPNNGSALSAQCSLFPFASQALDIGGLSPVDPLLETEEARIAMSHVPPYDALILEIHDWASARSARNVLYHVRRAGSNLLTHVTLVPGRFKDLSTAIPVLTDMFQDFPGAFLPKSFFPAGRILWAEFRDMGLKTETRSSNQVALPNIFLKGAPIRISPEIQSHLRNELRFSDARMEVVMASAEEGDLAKFGHIVQEVTARLPAGKLRFIIVPRRPAEVPLWRAKLQSLKIRVAVRRQDEHGLFYFDGRGDEPTLLNLSEGELQGIESISDIVLIGNTWTAGNDGHNIAEPASVGVPALFGRYVGLHYAYIAPLVLSGAGMVCHNPEMAIRLLLEFCRDPTRTKLLKMKASAPRAMALIEKDITKQGLKVLFEEWLNLPLLRPGAPLPIPESGGTIAPETHGAQAPAPVAPQASDADIPRGKGGGGITQLGAEIHLSEGDSPAISHLMEHRKGPNFEGFKLQSASHGPSSSHVSWVRSGEVDENVSSPDQDPMAQRLVDLFNNSPTVMELAHRGLTVGRLLHYFGGRTAERTHLASDIQRVFNEWVAKHYFSYDAFALAFKMTPLGDAYFQQRKNPAHRFVPSVHFPRDLSPIDQAKILKLVNQRSPSLLMELPTVLQKYLLSLNRSYKFRTLDKLEELLIELVTLSPNTPPNRLLHHWIRALMKRSRGIKLARGA